jgi:hypothetical protein
MNKRAWFLIAQAIIAVGVLGDYATTTIGLSSGQFYETNPEYTPLNAAALWTFWNLIFYATLKPTRRWQIPRLAIAFISWYGLMHNLWLLIM